MNHKSGYVFFRMAGDLSKHCGTRRMLRVLRNLVPSEAWRPLDSPVRPRSIAGTKTTEDWSTGLAWAG